MGKNNMETLLNRLEVDAAKAHDMIAVSEEEMNTRATALVSMTKAEKERLTSKAKAHGLSLSAFFRLAADEYMSNHNW